MGVLEAGSDEPAAVLPSAAPGSEPEVWTSVGNERFALKGSRPRSPADFYFELRGNEVLIWGPGPEGEVLERVHATDVVQIRAVPRADPSRVLGTVLGAALLLATLVLFRNPVLSFALIMATMAVSLTMYRLAVVQVRLADGRRFQVVVACQAEKVNFFGVDVERAGRRDRTSAPSPLAAASPTFRPFQGA